MHAASSQSPHATTVGSELSSLSRVRPRLHPPRLLRINSSKPLSDPECLISSDKKKRWMDGWWIKEKEAPGTKWLPTSCKHTMKYKLIVWMRCELRPYWRRDTAVT